MRSAQKVLLLHTLKHNGCLMEKHLWLNCELNTIFLERLKNHSYSESELLDSTLAIRIKDSTLAMRIKEYSWLYEKGIKILILIFFSYTSTKTTYGNRLDVEASENPAVFYKSKNQKELQKFKHCYSSHYIFLLQKMYLFFIKIWFRLTYEVCYFEMNILNMSQF